MVWPVLICWRMCWSRSSAITCRFIGSLRSSHAKASIWIVRHLPDGSAQRVNWSLRWSMRSGSMFWLHRRSTPTTRQFPYLHPVTERPRPAASGLTSVMTGPRHRPLPLPYGSPISENRKGEHARQHLKNFTGALQADAYSGLHHLYGDGRIYEVSCWAHARRKFHDIHLTHLSPITTEALNRIGALYGIEEQVRGKPPEVRCSVRQDQARPILDDFRRWMEKMLRSLSAKSNTAGAIRYALSHWRALTRYADDGLFEIDNSAAERRCAPSPSVGRTTCSSAPIPAV